jgi:hypothetical protein
VIDYRVLQQQSDSMLTWHTTFTCISLYGPVLQHRYFPITSPMSISGVCDSSAQPVHMAAAYACRQLSFNP